MEPYSFQFRLMHTVCLNHMLASKGFVKAFKISNMLDYVVRTPYGTLLSIKMLKKPVGKNINSGHLESSITITPHQCQTQVGGRIVH